MSLFTWEGKLLLAEKMRPWCFGYAADCGDSSPLAGSQPLRRKRSIPYRAASISSESVTSNSPSLRRASYNCAPRLRTSTQPD